MNTLKLRALGMMFMIYYIIIIENEANYNVKLLVGIPTNAASYSISNSLAQQSSTSFKKSEASNVDIGIDIQHKKTNPNTLTLCTKQLVAMPNIEFHTGLRNLNSEKI